MVYEDAATGISMDRDAGEVVLEGCKAFCGEDGEDGEPGDWDKAVDSILRELGEVPDGEDSVLGGLGGGALGAVVGAVLAKFLPGLPQWVKDGLQRAARETGNKVRQESRFHSLIRRRPALLSTVMPVRGRRSFLFFFLPSLGQSS